jgi:nucleoid DNA-binding protein
MIRFELITELSNKHPPAHRFYVELAVKTIIDSLENCLAKGGRVEFIFFSLHNWLFSQVIEFKMSASQ